MAESGAVASIWVSLGLRAAALINGLRQAQGELQNTAGAMAAVETRWKSVVGGLVRSVAAPVAGMLSLGAAARSYFSSVSEVARLTGAYSPKMEEWRKKRAMLQRVTREDIDLYRKGRESMTRFQISMEDLSAKAMRQAAPAMRWLYEALNKVSSWVDRNQDNIIRFLKVTAAVITVALIPSFIKLGAAMLANPLTWIIALLGVLALVIDDLVVYCQGGKSAFADLWSQFGTGEELSETLGNALTWLRETLVALLPFLVYLGAALASLKVGITVVNLLTKAWEAFSKALMLLKGHPVIAILTLIISLVMWFVDALDRAGGSWKGAFGVMWQDAKKFLNQFGGLGDLIEAAVTTMIKWFGELWDWIKKGIDKVVEFGSKLKEALSIDNLVNHAKEALKGLLPEWVTEKLGLNGDGEPGEEKKGSGLLGVQLPDQQGDGGAPERQGEGGKAPPIPDGQKGAAAPDQQEKGVWGRRLGPDTKFDAVNQQQANLRTKGQAGKAPPSTQAVPPNVAPPVREVDKGRQGAAAGGVVNNDSHDRVEQNVTIVVESGSEAAEVTGELQRQAMGQTDTSQMATA